MLISKDEFQKQLQEGRLKLCLMGMSNLGKTYWSKKLVNQGFQHICCDDLIEQKLGPELLNLGYSGIADVAKWLGQPYDERFSVNQKKYLDFEIETMDSILRKIDDFNTNITIDTTGSIIYTGEETCKKLQSKTLMIYIQASPEMLAGMLKRYLENPKPVVWGDSYAHSLEESYPKLLEYRSKQYEKYADIVLSAPILVDNISDEQEFIELINQQL